MNAEDLTVQDEPSRPDERRKTEKIGKLLISTGLLLTLSFVFLPSSITIHHEIGYISTLDSYFYVVFVLPLVVGGFLCLFTKRYYGIEAIGLLGILVFVLFPLNMLRNETEDVSIEYGYYFIMFGFLISTITAAFMAKKKGLKLFEREKLYVLALNIILSFIFVLLLLFSTASIRGRVGDVLAFYFILFLIAILTLPTEESLILSITGGKATERLVDFSLSLTVWGLYTLLFSILFLVGSACSCEGCITSFSPGLLLFTTISLWLGLGGLMARRTVKSRTND